MSNSERIQQLKDWNFELFELLTTFVRFPLKRILSNDEYDLIERAMTGKELTPNELHRFLLLFEKFLAKDEALEKILSMIIRLTLWVLAKSMRTA